MAASNFSNSNKVLYNLGSRQPRIELVWLLFLRRLRRLETHLGNFIQSHWARGFTLTRLCETEEEIEQKNIVRFFINGANISTRKSVCSTPIVETRTVATAKKMTF